VPVPNDLMRSRRCIRVHRRARRPPRRDRSCAMRRKSTRARIPSCRTWSHARGGPREDAALVAARAVFTQWRTVARGRRCVAQGSSPCRCRPQRRRVSSRA
jgi:hypothetical protein